MNLQFTWGIFLDDMKPVMHKQILLFCIFKKIKQWIQTQTPY
jgi:hypothetical protein